MHLRHVSRGQSLRFGLCIWGTEFLVDALYFRVSSERQTTENRFEDLLQVRAHGSPPRQRRWHVPGAPGGNIGMLPDGAGGGRLQRRWQARRGRALAQPGRRVFRPVADLSRNRHYSVRAEHAGFRTASVSDLELRTSAHLRVDLSLETGSVSEEISVTASAPLLETDTSERGQLIQGQQIRELPLNKRDYTQLVLLAPGTTYNADQRLGGAINVNGNRTLQNDYLLDGVDNNSHATSFRGDRVDVILPSVDAVQEFRVQSNAYSAEYGHSAGAVVNVTIKNGTNQFHGTGWEFFRAP